MKRTDVHRPSAIIAEDYEFVGFDHMKIESLGDVYVVLRERERIKAHMDKTGGTYSRHEHGGNCMVCGNANAMYTILFYHEKTKSYVRAGHECADKIDMSYGDFNKFRRGIENALEAQAGKKKAKTILDNAGLAECWFLFNEGKPPVCATCAQIDEGKVERFYHRCSAVWPKEEHTIIDIVAKLVKYGNISDKALNYLGKLLEAIDKRAEREVARKAEAEAAAPCPTGRVTITGVVLTTKVVESGFTFGWNREAPSVTKVLVRDDRGFKVWGTRPTIRLEDVKEEFGTREVYHCAERGDRIQFSANVSPSPEDTKFGFYKRPTKGELLAAAVSQEVK